MGNPGSATEYLLPLKTDHPEAILVTGDLGDPSDQCGPLNQLRFIIFNTDRPTVQPNGHTQQV